MLRQLSLLLLLFLVVPVALAAPTVLAAVSGLPAQGQAVVLSVASEGAITLADGRVVLPAAVRIPEMPQATLEGPLLNRTVELRGRPEPDRHGRMVAHLVRDDGVWLQAELLRQGEAVLFPEPEDAPVLPALRAAEAEAEAARRGLWGGRDTPVRSPNAVDGMAGSWQIVRGRVRKAARAGDRVYLNFGRDYRTDFTIEVATADQKLFAAAGIELLKLDGRTVEVRGLVEQRNGPAIALTLPVRLRVLD